MYRGGNAGRGLLNAKVPRPNSEEEPAVERLFERPRICRVGRRGEGSPGHRPEWPVPDKRQAASFPGFNIRAEFARLSSFFPFGGRPGPFLPSPLLSVAL